MKDAALRRYWIEFERTPQATATAFGVTAVDLADALQLIQRLDWMRGPLPAVHRVVEDVDISTLDPGRVLANMGPPTWRGVWYPNDVLR